MRNIKRSDVRLKYKSLEEAADKLYNGQYVEQSFPEDTSDISAFIKKDKEEQDSVKQKARR